MSNGSQHTVTPPAFVTIAGWCALSGMGRTSTNLALNCGQLHAVRLGRRVLIDVGPGIAWLRSLPAFVPAPRRS